MQGPTEEGTNMISGGRLLRHRKQLVDEMRVHRRHVETPRAHTTFSHRPATHTHTAQDESAYGAPSKCSLDFHTPVERQEQGRQKLLLFGTESCKHKPPVSHLCRRLLRPRKAVTSLRLPSQALAGYPPRLQLLDPGVLNRASELLQDGRSTLRLIMDF